MSLKNLFLNSAAGYTATFLIIGFGVLTKVFLTRLLSPADLGLFILAQTLFGMFVFIGSLGMNDAMVRYVGLESKSNASHLSAILSKVLRLLTAPCMILVILAISLASPLADYVIHNSRFSSVFILLALAIPFKLAADLIGSANQGMGRLYVKILLVDLAPAFLFSVGLGILLLLYKGSLNIVTTLYMLPFVIAPFLFRGQLKFGAIFRHCKTSVTTHDLFHYATPLLLSGIVAWPLTLVPIAIGSLTSTEAVSYYSLAISLASFIYLGASVTEAAGFSVWTTYLAANEAGKIMEDYKLSTRWGTVLGSVVFLPLFICPHEVVNLLFGLKYEPVSEILPVISSIFFINLIVGPTESILKAYGNTRFIFMTRLAVGIVIAITLYPFLILWGLNGAIVVYGLSVAVGGVGMYSWYLYKCHGIHPFDKHYLRMLVVISSATLFTFLLVRNVPPWGGVFIIISSVLVYCIFLIFLALTLHAIAPRDRQIISRAFSYACMALRAK